jgi:predicted nuclease of predicted toxin-antitoxin system
MARFLIDEDLPVLLASLLRERGHAADDIQELNLRGSPDARVYAAAQKRQAVIVTGDGDFGNLLRFPLASHFGIVMVQYPTVMRTRELAAQISDILSSLDSAIFKGSLVIIEPGRTRIKRPA